MVGKRKYEQKARAERHEETRRRITEATAALHQEVGPALATISAIAERAGVERLTVYRHFPDEGELFQACQQHFMAQHPPPDPTTWAGVASPAERLRLALTAIYAWYRDTEAMTANILHDAPLMPELSATLAGRDAFFAAQQARLVEGWGVSDEAQQILSAAIGHALDFEAWRSLVRRQHLSDEQAVTLMLRLVTALAEGKPANAAASQG